MSGFEQLKSPDTPAPIVALAEGESAPFRAVNPPRSAIVEVVLEVLSTAEKPMSRRELFRAITERGVSIVGKEPITTFGTMMWRERGWRCCLG
jgi:hypothetical protein